MEPRIRSVYAVVVFAVIIGIAVPAFATFTSPLSSSDIREAYIIGDHRNWQTEDFLSQYVHKFPDPNTDSYVCQIGIDTPFTQVVRHSEAAYNYHAPDAVEEFEGKALPFTVNVEIKLNADYPTVTGDAPALAQLVPPFWNDYKVELVQDHEVAAVTVRGGPIYAYGWKFSPMVTGARIQAIYNPEKISADPVTIRVVGPDGQTVETKFDLTKLR
jgi:hypothetical protein